MPLRTTRTPRNCVQPKQTLATQQLDPNLLDADPFKAFAHHTADAVREGVLVNLVTAGIALYERSVHVKQLHRVLSAVDGSAYARKHV